MSARAVLVVAALVFTACAEPGEKPLFGAPRDFPDPLRAAPAYCVLGTNCVRFETPCAYVYPDGEGGLWCHAVNETDNEVQDLVHARRDGTEDVREPLGKFSYPRLALAPGGALALVGIGNRDVTVGGVTQAPASLQFAVGWVGVRRSATTGWLRIFGSTVLFHDVAWLPDGRVLTLASCSGVHATPLPLDCSVDPGAALLTFAADGSSVERQALPEVTTPPRRFVFGPDNAAYVLSGDSSGGAAVHRFDAGKRWSNALGNTRVGPSFPSAHVAADGHLWLSLLFPVGSPLILDGQTLGGASANSGLVLVRLDSSGRVASVQLGSTGARAQGLAGFAELPGGDLLGCWSVLRSEGNPLSEPYAFPGSQVVQFAAAGHWRGVRGGDCDAVTSDRAGRSYFTLPVLPELSPGEKVIRVDPTPD